MLLKLQPIQNILIKVMRELCTWLWSTYHLICETPFERHNVRHPVTHLPESLILSFTPRWMSSGLRKWTLPPRSDIPAGEWICLKTSHRIIQHIITWQDNNLHKHLISPKDFCKQPQQTATAKYFCKLLNYQQSKAILPGSYSCHLWIWHLRVLDNVENN